MFGTPAPTAWETLVEYATEDGSRVYTVSQEVPSTIEYDQAANAVVLVSQHHATSGEPFPLEQPRFMRVWNRIRDGATLSRDDQPGYDSLPALIDGRCRASGVMGTLDTVFEEIESDRGPVRVWIEE